ncbi:MAG: DUF1648 domain-containing protein [Sphingobacteriales bacterium]|nr:MAG: DUF1648 domain-containing protein [Sphingobacteriales bacterium]
MTERPKLNIPLSTFDFIVNSLSFLALTAIWIAVILNYSSLPDLIPVHFNAAGQPDSFGQKYHILVLPVIASLLSIGLTLLCRSPHLLNYPVNITNENALYQYTIAIKTIRYLRLIIILIFGYLAFKIIQQANGQSDGLGVWFLPVILGLIFIPSGYFLVQLTKTKS